jgi:hypothetical protein
VVRKLHEVGFRGFFIDDHVPFMVNDSAWGHRGRAFETGYIKALIDVVNCELVGELSPLVLNEAASSAVTAQ